MNISIDLTKLTDALSGIHSDFRQFIIDLYIEIKKRQVRSNFTDEYDAVGLSSGKFCETVYRFLELEIYKKYTPFSTHIPNFPNALEKLSQSPKNSGLESLRVIIPRVLLLIYTLRNKRGIGHVGGDIEANQIDVSTIVKNVDWVICELIRIYHNLPISEAQLIIDTLNIKVIPDIWSVNGKRRVLRGNLKFNELVLVILYNEIDNKANWKDLFDWTEYSNPSMFKAKVLIPLHKLKMIEFNPNSGEVKISPKGIHEAEKILIHNFNQLE